MAKVLEFGAGIAVIDIEVTTPEGKFKGAAFKESRYGYKFEATIEEPGALAGPLKEYAEAVIRAAAEFESAVHVERTKLVKSVEDAQRRLGEELKQQAQAAAPAPAPAAEAAPTPEAAPQQLLG